MHLALIAAVVALAAAPPEGAPAPTLRENQLLFQPQPGGIAVAYARALSESWAVTAALGGVANISDTLGSVGARSTIWGAGLDLGLTRYLVSRALAGPWVGMRMGAHYEQSTFGPAVPVPGAQPVQGHSSGVRGAVLFGFTAILEPGFTIQLAAGPEVHRFFQQVNPPGRPPRRCGASRRGRSWA
ncbi:MAG TPA: hypothetical protein VFA20_06475 [Myxococcaceae bacterium]|nr:hypothetical protein [Myxococcaceae bacterium]